MLSEMPGDRLLQVVYDAEQIESPFIRIPESAALLDVVMRAPVRLLRRARGASSIPAPGGLNDAIKVSGDGLRARVWRSLRAAADIAPVRLPRSFIDEIRRFEPEAIYTLLGNVRMMKLAIALSKKLDIPIVPHFMDDWGGTLYPNGELGGLARRSVERSFDRVIARSPDLVCIGERMAEEYQDRFDRRAFVAAFGAEEAVTSEFTASARAPRTLVYAGGLHLGREAVLRWAATALKNTGWHLEVYSPSPGVSHPNITYKTKVPVADIPTVLAAADALLFVESLDPAIADYTRLSVSTKTAQYVVANRPTVLVGPARQASIELLERSLPSRTSFASLDGQSAASLSTFLAEASRRDIPSRPLPAEFAAKKMRAGLEEALSISIADWRERAGEKG
ncbi:MAG: hypothetical protein B7X32_12855 [Microbacterium sp. 13-71-7]|nr:MAG: hypothetical protein B7X32_12855 [Microbacterium sp. 13-71-7]